MEGKENSFGTDCISIVRLAPEGRYEKNHLRGQTGRHRTEGETDRHSQALPPAHAVLLQTEGGDARQRVTGEQHQTGRCEEERRMMRHSAKAAEHRKSWKSASQLELDGRARLQSPHKEKIEKGEPECSQQSCGRTSGDAGLDCVKQNTTQHIVSCRTATCTVILCLQQNKG